MAKTIQQLESEANAAALIKQRQEQYPLRFTADHAERLSKATYGSTFTNPEVTASIGLSDIPIDTSIIHTNSQVQARTANASLDARYNGIAGLPPSPADDYSKNYTIVDLLKMNPAEFYAPRHNKTPKWWDRVDPEGFWRTVQTPKEINNAKDLLNLDEAQVIKLYISSTPEQWNAIPGMIPQSTWTADNKRVPGSFDSTYDLPAKFPYLKQILDADKAVSEKINNQNTTGIEGIFGQIQTAWQQAATTAIVSAQVPFKVMSFLTPDHIGPSGGMQVAGINLPSNINLTKIGKPARALTKTAIAPLQAAQQMGKNYVEQVILEDGKLDSKDVLNVLNPFATIPTLAKIALDPEKRHNFVQSVLVGNVLTQIGKQLIAKQKLDVGGGMFIGGKAMEDSIAARDASVPQIEGRTWTFGNALIEPLIQEQYIDRNGYAASVLSGIADGVFTVATDISSYTDIIGNVAKAFGVTEKIGAEIVHGRAGEILAERTFKDNETLRNAKLFPKSDVIEGYLVGEAPQVNQVVEDVSRMLPSGTKLPEDAELLAQQIAD